MDILLPTIQSGLLIGILDVDDNTMEVITNLQYNCQITGNCCTNLIVPVSDFDIQKIEDHGFEFDQIVSDDAPAITRPKDKFGTLEKSYLIKRKPFTGECTFMENNRCTIHEFKPFACRIFPLQLKHISSSKVEVLIHDSNYCPNVIPCNIEESETEELLTDLLNDMNHELDAREAYIKKFGKPV